MNADPFDDDRFDEACADHLANDGFVVIDGWLGDAHATSLRAEHAALFDRGAFRPARIGHGHQRQTAAAIRSDRICWFNVDGDADSNDDDGSVDDDDGDAADGVRPGPAVIDLLGRLDGLRAILNRSCFLALTRIELHAACYDPGVGYDAHVDVFGDDSRRVISFSHYLNADWVPADGGCLRMEGVVARDIAPIFDRLVVFQSRTQRHAVLPVARRRWSSTGWMSGT